MKIYFLFIQHSLYKLNHFLDILLKQMMNYDNEEILRRRLQKFKQAIRKYQEQEVAIIQQKSRDEQ